MKVVIIGQGAIGLLLYVHLIKSQSITPSLLSSSRQFTKHKTFTFKNQQGDEHQLPLNHANFSDLANAQVVIYTVKSYQLEQALVDTLSYIKPTSQIIYCHNGMVNLSLLPFKIPYIQLSLLVTHGCKKLSETMIEHTGYGHLDIGFCSEKEDIHVQESLLALFQQCLPDCFWHNDIQKIQWTKLAINCVINPITAINDITNGQVAEPSYKAQIYQIIKEVVLVATAKNITLCEIQLLQAVMTVADKTKRNSSSMRCDVLANRKTEIDAINGYIAKEGKALGIDVLENTRLWQHVKALSVN